MHASPASRTPGPQADLLIVHDEPAHLHLLAAMLVDQGLVRSALPNTAHEFLMDAPQHEDITLFVVVRG